MIQCMPACDNNLINRLDFNHKKTISDRSGISAGPERAAGVTVPEILISAWVLTGTTKVLHGDEYGRHELMIIE